MWFGQKVARSRKASYPGPWIPFDTREEAVVAGCARISVLELACSVADYFHWMAAVRSSGRDPKKTRLEVPFRGPFYADFDDAAHLSTLKDNLAGQLETLIDRYDMIPRDFDLWFTGGKGFHLLMDPVLFDAGALCHPLLPRIYKRFAYRLGFGDLMDPCVYSMGRGRLWRVEGISRSNGCRKTPITLDQLHRLPMAQLFSLARHPAQPLPFHKP